MSLTKLYQGIISGFLNLLKHTQKPYIDVSVLNRDPFTCPLCHSQAESPFTLRIGKRFLLRFFSTTLQVEGLESSYVPLLVHKDHHQRSHYEYDLAILSEKADAIYIERVSWGYQILQFLSPSHGVLDIYTASDFTCGGWVLLGVKRALHCLLYLCAGTVFEILFLDTWTLSWPMILELNRG